MSEPWTPKPGELVRYRCDYVWPALRRGLPVNIRVMTVDKVSKAGYVTLKDSPYKFKRANDERFSEVRAKRYGLSDYRTYIEPISLGEAMTLPTTSRDGQHYARRIHDDLYQERKAHAGS